MKILSTTFTFLVLLSSYLLNHGISQVTTESTNYVAQTIYVIETNDGGLFIGTILSQDSKEVLILTKDRGEISIPKYQIKSMNELKDSQIDKNGAYVPNEVFSTRYFLTTNALPVEKGENYVLLNVFGPEVHFGITDKLGLGVMTSWIAIPVVFTAKYSINISEKANFGLGVLAGTGSWIIPEFAGILPFANLTYGDRRSNINLSVGYVGLGEFGGPLDISSPLISVAGLAKIGSSKFSFVFDSFVVPGIGYRTITQQTGWNSTINQPIYSTIRIKNPSGALIMPGLRVQVKEKSAFQFAFGGLVTSRFTAPVPTLGWFIKI